VLISLVGADMAESRKLAGLPIIWFLLPTQVLGLDGSWQGSALFRGQWRFMEAEFSENPQVRAKIDLPQQRHELKNFASLAESVGKDLSWLMGSLLHSDGSFSFGSGPCACATLRNLHVLGSSLDSHSHSRWVEHYH